ncbi:MAG: hypothetical protein HFE04_00815, partial [Bacilli bacterium]|nr:hypothetical protein [Bacilli bacterium]
MKSQKYSNYIKAKYIRCFVCGTKKPKSILNEKKQEIHNDLNNNNEPSRSKKIFNYLFSIYSISYIFFLIYCVIVMFGTKEELLSAFLLLFSVQSIVTIFSIVKTYKFIENNFDSTYNKISKRFLINMIIIFLIYFFLDFFNSKFIENEFLK